MGKEAVGSDFLDFMIKIFQENFDEVFARDTCYPPSQKDWTPENPSFGHCAVAVLIAQDYFSGGEIVGCRHHHHYWYKLNGKDMDFTRGQFPEGTEFCIDSHPTREELLDAPRAVEAKTRKRYELLKKRFWENMAKSKKV
jgi:hypothetical protein